MPSTRQPYRRAMPFYAAIAVALLASCGRESPPSLSAPSAVEPVDIPVASAAPGPPTQAAQPAKAASDVAAASVPFSDYGCMHIQAGPVNFQDDGFLPDDAVVRIRFVATSADPANDYVHAAVFKVIEGEPQQLNNSAFKEFRVGALDIFTIEVPIKNVQECVTYQVDAGCGRRPPPDAVYRGSSDFIESWRIGNRCAPLPTPEPTPNPTPTPTPGPSPTPTSTPQSTPTPTPTPACNTRAGFLKARSADECSTPTPTPTPRSTPTVTPTPRSTPTPTPRGTPSATPTPTATPTPSPTPRSTPTPTPTPRSTPTPTPTTPPTPTPTPPCRTNHTFSHNPNVRIGGTGYLTGTASFNGPGFWEFRIAATSSQSKCINRVYDYPQKQYQSRRYQCGDSTNGNIDIQYAWGTHASNWWRVTLELDGVIVGDSGCLDNPYN